MRKLAIMLMTATFAIGAAGALAACGSDSKSPEDAARDAANQVDDLDIDFDTDGDGEDDTRVDTCSDLPEGFPNDDISLPDEPPTTCSRTVVDGDASFSLLWDSDVFDELKSELTDSGFTLDQESESDQGDSSSKYASFSGDDWDVSLSLSIYDDDDFGGTTTSINVYKASEF